MLAPGSEISSQSGWSELALESHAAYEAFVKELSLETGLGIDYRACGAVELAHDESEWRLLRLRAQDQKVLGIASAFLTPEQTVALLPNLSPRGLLGSVHYPKDAIVDPCHIMKCLRKALISRGVRLIENRPVKSIDVAGAGVCLETDDGKSVNADAAVIAAGAWSGEIPVVGPKGAEPKPGTFPVRGHLVAYRLPPNTLGPIVRHGHTYLLQRSDGRLIGGASQEQVGFDRQIDAATVAGIHRSVSQLLPGILPEAPEESWIGFRPATAGFVPEIRRLENTPVWIAYGHFRNGILLAPATAARITSQILSS